MTLQLLFFGSIPNSDSIRTAKFLMLIINSTIVRVNLVIPQPAIGDRMDVQTEIVSQEKQFRKHVALAAGSLMLTLAMWALASPLGATPDEWLHLGSIYCANGVDGELCHKISSENVLTASADINHEYCRPFFVRRSKDWQLPDGFEQLPKGLLPSDECIYSPFWVNQRYCNETF